MNPLYLWAWGIFLGFSTVSLFITHSVTQALILGLLASFSAWATAQRVGVRWKRRAQAYAAAARGIVVDSNAGDDDPVRLAREVQLAAIQGRRDARALSVLRAVIDGMSEGVWITSEDGTVIEHNNALKEFLYRGLDIVGHRPKDLVDTPELQTAVDLACRKGQPSRLELTLEGVRPYVLLVHVAPLGGELLGSSAVFIDVTELRRLEKVRKDFVANVSHELRTPITAIRGYAETLLSGALSDPVAAPKMVDIIHRQSERLSELVEDLLELSRIEARQLQLAVQPVALLEATQRVLDTVRPKAKVRGTHFNLHIPAQVAVLGDQRAVEQMVLNLVDNAIKYSPVGAHVELTAQESDGRVRLKVKDDGPGIDAKHVPRIFERFYRVDKGRAREMGGTGLGLSIVKHLAAAMNGEVHCESTPGAGSTFVVDLPSASGAAKLP